MSKTLVLEIPNEVFSSVQRQAESKGSTAEKFAVEIILKNFRKAGGHITEQDKNDALDELMRFSGAVSSGDRNFADNVRIDADLAAEYNKDL